MSTHNSSLISVIIPALNEAREILPTLDSCRAPGAELWVVDGGSRDETAALARSWGARVLDCTGGRARQMNLGARHARGDLLLFLHADTRLPRGFDECVRRVLADPQVAAGAFRLGIDSPGRGLRVIETVANWRSRFLHLPYGDQGLFLRRSVFERAGGFPLLPIMEDFEFVRRLAGLGRVVIAPLAVSTSARRWHQVGPWKTTLINQTLVTGYLLGVSCERLARWYRGNGTR